METSGSPSGVEAQDEEDTEDEDLPREEPQTFARCIKAPSGMESIAFDDYWSPQYSDYLNRQGAFDGKSQRWLPRCRRWFRLVLIGLITGCIAILVEVSMLYLFELRFGFNDSVADSGAGVFVQWLAFVSVSIAYAAVAGVLVCYVEVVAAGSGIPEIKCFLNGLNLPNVVGIKTLLVKSVGIVFSVAAGLPCGKEGPMIHSGAIVGAVAASYNLRAAIKPVNIDEEIRDFVAAGAAAGVSAAFGAPMGGVLFAIEEGTSHMTPSLMLRLFVACSVADLVSRIFAGRLEGGLPWGELGTRVPVSFGKFTETTYHVLEFPIFAFMACCGGLLGALFNLANKKVSLWRNRWIGSHGTYRFIEVLVVTATISSITFSVPIVSHGGLVPLRHSDLNPSESLFWSPGVTALKDLFHNSQYNYEVSLLLPFGFCNFFLSCWTYGLGVPSGLFVPCLLTGASSGRLVGELCQRVFSSMLGRDGELTQHADPGVYALLGAAAMLAGTTRITISLAMLLLEVTGNTGCSLPMFMTVMIAKWVGDVFSRGIYDLHIIELKHVPLLEQSPDDRMRTLQARDVMAAPVKTLDLVSTVKAILETLDSCHHHAFPVVHHESKVFLGIVTRDVLKAILRSREGHNILQSSLASLQQPPPMVPFEAATEREVEFTSDDFARLVDLSQFVNYSCYTMPQHANLSTCYKLFRKLGLRHLPVVSRVGMVCGMITRQNLILCEEEEQSKREVYRLAGSSDWSDSSDDDEIVSVGSELFRLTEGRSTSSRGLGGFFGL